MNAPHHRPSYHPTPAHAAAPAPTGARVRVGDDGFVSEAVLAAWLRAGEAVRAGGLLRSRDGRSFVLRDAVRILGRRNGETDPYGLTGRVESLRDLIRQGATASESGVKLGPAVYDIEYGVIARPLASPDESGPTAVLSG